MAGEKIAIKIVPTPATQDLPDEDLTRVSRVTKLPVERVRARIINGKSITIVTPEHPRVADLIQLFKTMGFSVVSGPVASEPKRSAGEAKPLPVEKDSRSGRTRDSGKPAERSEWTVGDIIDNLYEVKDIRSGGMGSVYLAWHRRWNTMLAIKSLLQRLRDSQEDRSLFIKEAETWIDIGFHPNIAACYYVKNILDSPRIFIEYVDGGAMSEWLNRRKHVGWDLIIDVMVQVADGLGHAHAKGLVHRDVKPGNCMLTQDGVVKVTDFGLTKRRSRNAASDVVASAGSAESVMRDRESITAQGMGTPGYMAPEMWIPEAEVGPPADIYAFGVMLFEICCRRKPFTLKKGEKRNKLALAHIKKPPPRPTQFRKDIPPGIEEVILKCLRKNAQERFQTCLDLREALADVYEDIFRHRFERPLPDEVNLVPDALNNRAVSLMDLNHQEEAQENLRQAIQIDSHHPEAVYNSGLLEWTRTSNPTWDLVVRLEEVVTTPEYRSRGSYLLSRSLLSLGDADRAFKAAQTALAGDEAAEEWVKPYAIALIGTGQEEEAIRKLQEYAETNSSDEEALGWLIGALVRSGRRDEALAQMEHLAAQSELAGLSPEEIEAGYRYAGLKEIASFENHKGWVHCLADFPESGLVLSGARDRTLKIWHPATGEEQRSITVVGQPPSRAWISPDGRLVAVASGNKGVPAKILNLDTEKFGGNLLAQQGPISALGFTADSRYVLTVEGTGASRFWDTEAFRSAGSHKLPPHTAADVVMTTESDATVFLAGRDRQIKRVRLKDGDVQIFQKDVHSELVTCLVAAPDGSRVLTGGKDRKVVVWDGHTGKDLAVFTAHEDQVQLVALNPIVLLAASYDQKGGIKLWDTQTGEVIRTYPFGEAELDCMVFSRDGQRLMAGSRDMKVRVWNVVGKRLTPEFALARIRSVTKQMKSDKEFKSLADRAKKAVRRHAYATAYDLLRRAQTLPGYERSETVLNTIHRFKDKGRREGLHRAWNKNSFHTPAGVLAVAFSPSAISFITGHSDHEIRVSSSKTGQTQKVLKGHTNVVATFGLSKNGRELVSGSDDRTIRTWDLNTARNVLTLKGHAGSVSSVGYSPEEDIIISASWDSTIKIWSHHDGTLIRTLKGHEDKVTAVAFTANPDLLVSAAFDGLVKMWETSSGRPLRDLRGHKDRITALRLSSCGELLVSCSMDGTARVWEVRRGALLHTLEVDESGLRTAAFAPTKRFLLTGGTDTVMRMWDLESETCLREFQGHSREITDVAFSLDGRFAISASADGMVIIWELDWDWVFQDEAPPPNADPFES